MPFRSLYVFVYSSATTSKYLPIQIQGDCTETLSTTTTTTSTTDKAKKIVFFLLCVTFTTAEDEEVILEKLWHQVSTFQLEQSMTPTMEFAHLVAPIDFTTVEDTRDELKNS